MRWLNDEGQIHLGCGKTPLEAVDHSDLSDQKEPSNDGTDNVGSSYVLTFGSHNQTWHIIKGDLTVSRCCELMVSGFRNFG